MLIGLMIIGMLFTLSMPGTGGMAIPDTGEPGSPGDGDDSLTGGDSDDLIDGLGGSDTIDGGAGNDTLSGNEGDDWLLGSEGNDLLSGGLGIDTLEGGEGDDTLTLSDGFETRWHYDEDGRVTDLERSHLDGGDGSETEGDLLDAAAMTQALHLYVEGDLSFIATSPRGESAATVDGFERYALGSGHDVIEYYREGESLVFDTGAGDDALYLANGGHQLQAGRGEDRVSLFAEGAFGDGLFLDGGQGEEGLGDQLEVESDQRLDMAIDGSGSGTITDGAGGTLRFANFERFSVNGTETHIDASAAGLDLVIESRGEISTVIGGSGNDSLGGNELFGGDGNDELSGGAYADGGDGNDIVSADRAFGGAGDDTILGGEMTGGSGIDSFLARAGIGDGIDSRYQPDIITDYQAGESVVLSVNYHAVDSNDPSITHPEPTVSIERIEGETRVNLLVDGQVVLVIEGDSIPDEAIEIVIRGSNPWLA